MKKNKKDDAGCVAAGTPEAARAGAEILEEGGNALDAAVAVSLVLGVT
jgi:gamma-glutamyltranspeptidase/glutathione hydrolase